MHPLAVTTCAIQVTEPPILFPKGNRYLPLKIVLRAPLEMMHQYGDISIKLHDTILVRIGIDPVQAQHGAYPVVEMSRVLSRQPDCHIKILASPELRVPPPHRLDG